MLTLSTARTNIMREGYLNAIGCPSRQHFFNLVKDTDPKNYVLQYERLEYYADKHFAAPKVVYSPPFTEFVRVPQEMKDWVETQLPNKERPKTLVVWGPSRTGKTNWARSLGHHTYLGFTWSVKQLDEGSSYIVIDDIDLSNFKLWQPFLGK